MHPRSQAPPSCGGKTLTGAGHMSHGNFIAQGGIGKVSIYMLPLPHFTLRLQGVSVFCSIIVILNYGTINFNNHIKFKYLINLII